MRGRVEVVAASGSVGYQGHVAAKVTIQILGAKVECVRLRDEAESGSASSVCFDSYETLRQGA